MFYPKTMNKWKGKNDQEIFPDQIFIQRIEHFLLRGKKRTNFLHLRERVVDSICLNRCLLEFKARNCVGLCWRFWKFWNNCKVFKIKIRYLTILLGYIWTLKTDINYSKSWAKTYKSLASTRYLWQIYAWICLNRCLLEFKARNCVGLCWRFWKFWNNCKVFKIKIRYLTILLGYIWTLKTDINYSKSWAKTYKSLASTRHLW